MLRGIASIGALAVLGAACGSVASDAVDASLCPELRADCNGLAEDGCEADLSLPTSCGECTEVCGAPRRATATCEGGVCDYVCNAGLVRCGQECLPDCATSFGTPGEHPLVVQPECEEMRIRVWGAGGGHGVGNTLGAAGGYAEARIELVVGETLTIVVGSSGGAATGGNGGSTGLPGGGSGGSGSGEGGGGGGGLSGVFRGAPGPATALVIAGGGGGSGGGTAAMVSAGAGGGVDGQSRNGITAGTQSTGFGSLTGGTGASGEVDGGGGGGSGWFGGNGGSAAQADGFGGAGGSGFVAISAADVMLLTGDGALPGAGADPERAGAGEPGIPGRVIADCSQ